MPTIEFIVDDDGKMELKLKGPKSIHALKPIFDADLADLSGEAKTVEKPELTEEPQRTAVPSRAVKQAGS